MQEDLDIVDSKVLQAGWAQAAPAQCLRRTLCILNKITQSRWVFQGCYKVRQWDQDRRFEDQNSGSMSSSVMRNQGHRKLRFCKLVAASIKKQVFTRFMATAVTWDVHWLLF